MKQLRKGLKESGVLTMIKERPALAEVLFPKSAEQVMDTQTILKRIICQCQIVRMRMTTATWRRHAW
ncbi:hypothetical protein AMECASPLE_035348 [Ameca splendens]|uniref:Uncharacterized protein n=1 Tax=Ameca splendens TaxID=208324 RepID=A0ABV0Y7L2_9TELE